MHHVFLILLIRVLINGFIDWVIVIVKVITAMVHFDVIICSWYNRNWLAFIKKREHDFKKRKKEILFFLNTF